MRGALLNKIVTCWKLSRKGMPKRCKVANCAPKDIGKNNCTLMGLGFEAGEKYWVPVKNIHLCFLPPFLLLPALCHWISFLVPNIWSAWPCLKILWQVVSRQLMWLGEGTLLLVNEGLQVHLSSGQGQGGRGRFGPEEEGEQH